MWVGLNVLPAMAGSLLVTYIEPVALGSGIPQIKCYLNGILKTLYCLRLRVYGNYFFRREGAEGSEDKNTLLQGYWCCVFCLGWPGSG